MTTTETNQAVQVLDRYHNGAGVEYARRLQLPSGVRVTVGLDKGDVRWADSDFWADPERFGGVRVFCTGHGRSKVCPYGMHDYIRLEIDECDRWAVEVLAQLARGKVK